MKDLLAVSRRRFFTLAAAGLSLASFPELLAEAQEGVKGKAGQPVNPDHALRDLLDGNKRFVKGHPINPRRNPAYFSGLAAGQYPEAVILCCADSRVAPEIIFDVGLGDIFVVRIAGNVVSGAGEAVKGSIEYAVEELNVPLIMLLGHSGCGAVKAAKEHMNDKAPIPGAIGGLVGLIKPAVAQSAGGPGDPLENAIRKNVEIGVELLEKLQPILAPRFSKGKLKIVGAEYDLRTGEVTLLKPVKS